MNKYNIKIISQSNEIVVEQDIVKYEWITENKINVYDENEKKTSYFIAAFCVIIKEIN